MGEETTRLGCGAKRCGGSARGCQTGGCVAASVLEAQTNLSGRMCVNGITPEKAVKLVLL
ncbi:MAG: hypothetical protein QW514_01295 [Thermoprotei archaeon]